MPVSAEQTRLGDYRVGGLLSEGTCTRTYQAEQISVNREVVLEKIKDEFGSEPEVVEHFLADVRAKAAVDHPGIGSVYEAVQDAEAVFYTRELLPGKTFEELHDENVDFEPATIATFLRQLGSAMEYLQERGIATLPLEPCHLVQGDQEVLRIVNLAVAEPVPSPEGHDRHLVAELFLDLLRRGRPGATRTRTLLTMMAERDGTELTWRQVAHTARKLEQDLSAGAKAAARANETEPGKKAPASKRMRRILIWVLMGSLVLGALAAGGLLLRKRIAVPKARDLRAMVAIDGGRYQTADGQAVSLKRFWIDAHEVTIAEYAEFLEVLARLPASKRTGYDHRDQPAGKRDHFPDDWEATLAGARSGKTTEGLPLDLNYPVTKVDWWDAYAYANWRGGRLPTEEEWSAVSGQADLVPGGRGPVDAFPGDLTAQGIHGLAGNVSEWVRDSAGKPALPSRPTSGDSAGKPALPAQPARPLACGGSHRERGDGARLRIRLANRDVRRDDLGFRIVRDAAP